MWNVNLFQYWWYISPVIWVVSCLVAGISNYYGQKIDHIIIICGIIFTIAWPIILPPLGIALMIGSLSYLLYWVGKSLPPLLRLIFSTLSSK